jgi:hypothetical protein
VTSKGNQIMGQLPLTVDGTLDWIMGDYASSQFTLNVLDESLPSNWEELVEPQKMSIWVLDSDFAEPLWAGTITDVPRTGNGSVTINCLSFEGYLANRLVGDAAYNEMDPMLALQKIMEDWVDNVEMDSGGASYVTGLGFELDIQMSGLLRSVSFNKSDYKSVLDVIKNWAISVEFEWSILPKYTADGTGVRKVFYARHKHIGVITDTPNHEFIMGGNVSACTYTVATNGGAFATRLTATGDGTGALQTRSKPVTNFNLERSGYPRIEQQKSYTGISYTEDIQYLADHDGPALWARHEIITVEAHDNGATNLTTVGRGDSVRVTIRSSELKTSKVLRMVGFSVGNDSAAFRPTLAELGTSQAKFARAVDPSVDRSALDANNKAKEAFNRDSNSLWVPFPDGTGAWTVDPIAGFGSYDPDTGNFGSIKDEVQKIVTKSFYRKDIYTDHATGIGTDANGEPLDELVSNSQHLTFWNAAGAPVAQFGSGDEGPGGFLGRRDFLALGAGSITENSFNRRGHVMKFWDTGEYTIGGLQRVQKQDGSGEFKDSLYGKHIEIGTLSQGSSIDGVPIDGEWKAETISVAGGSVSVHSGDADLFLTAGQGFDVRMSHAKFAEGMVVDGGFQSLPGSGFNVGGDGTFTGSVYASTFGAQTKSFFQVLPTDHTKKVEYRSTEAPFNGIQDVGNVLLDDEGMAVVKLASHFAAVMIPGSLNVQLNHLGGRATCPPSREPEVDGSFVVYGTPGMELEWLATAKRQSLNKDGVDVIALTVITDNDLPDYFQPDYVAPELPSGDEEE